jgi:hypothetical protein
VTNASDLARRSSATRRFAAGRMNWEIFLKWLISRAQAGVPVDTVVGNWDMAFEWERMFATPTYGARARRSSRSSPRRASRPRSRTRASSQRVNFEVSSAAPAAKLIGFIKGETIEELIENGSDIEESVRSIENQKVRYVKTKNHGYRLVFADTRDILNLDAVAAG